VGIEQAVPEKHKAILIVDDHPIVRRGLKLIVQQELPGWHIGEAGDGAETRRKLSERTWDLLILDISLPDVDGLELLKEIKGRYKASVLCFSIHPEKPFAMHAFKAGADGYLTKDRLDEELADALRIVAKRKKYVSPSLAVFLAEQAAGGSRRPAHESLSLREMAVLRELGAGLTVSEIAEKMELSPKTVSTYRRRVLKKLGLRNNAELVRFALNEKLIP